MTEARTIKSFEKGDQDLLLIRTLSAAFADSPALSWILPDAELRHARLPGLFATMIKSDRKAGAVLASPGGEVASLWRGPGCSRASIGETLRDAIPMVRTFGAALGRGIAVSAGMEGHHPMPNDYWYLQYVGVAPDHQGKGWGGAVIRHGIEMAAAQGKPVLLETDKPANMALYLHMGFQIIDEWDVPKSAVHFWTMLRPLGD